MTASSLPSLFIMACQVCSASHVHGGTFAVDTEFIKRVEEIGLGLLVAVVACSGKFKMVPTAPSVSANAMYTPPCSMPSGYTTVR